MKDTEAALILQSLIEGREPGSDNTLPTDSIVHRADVLRALLTSVRALDRAAARVQRRALMPDNVGQPWTDDEETRMEEAFKSGNSPEEIARRHRRTLRAIEARLERLGLITAEERTTVGGFPSAA